MDPHEPSRPGSPPIGRRGAVFAAFAIVSLSPGTPTGAQTRTVRDTATAYGARLDAKGEPANSNPNRINNRVSNRLDTRLSLRIERYRPDSTISPPATFAAQAADRARIGTETTLSPLATSQRDAASSSQVSPGLADQSAQPR